MVLKKKCITRIELTQANRSIDGVIRFEYIFIYFNTKFRRRKIQIIIKKKKQQQQQWGGFLVGDMICAEQPMKGK